LRSSQPILTGLLGISLSFIIAAPIAAQTPSRSVRQLAMNVPDAVSRSVNLRPTEPSTVLKLAITLPFSDSAAVDRTLDAVSNPKSPSYRHFMTSEQIGARFGLPKAKVQKVVDYLKGQGFNVSYVAKTRLAIFAEGTVAQAEKAFNTKLRDFAASNAAELPNPIFRSYTKAPSVPADIQPYIVDIAGLETYTHAKPRYVSPSQIRTLYNIKPLYDTNYTGLGRTIAITNWDGYRLANVTAAYTKWGLPTPAGGVGSNIKVVPIDGGSGSGNQGGEGDLDTQAILTVAPLAKLIIYDGSISPFNPIKVWTTISDANEADIVSESYGISFGSDSTASSANDLHKAMNLKGITYMAASGDNGTKITDYPYPDYDPEVLIVGGTTANVNASGVRTSETGWSGSGGGWIVNALPFNKLPSFQSSLSSLGVNYRLVPDIGLNADPNTGYAVIIGNNTYTIGGTSGASPTFAAGLAIAQQRQIALGNLPADANGNRRHGRIQDLLYSFKGDASLFYDITSGSNGQLPNGTTSNAKVGWDFVTGWGALDFLAFSKTGAVLPVVSSLTVSPTSVVGGSATTVTGTVTLDKAAAATATVTLTSSDASATVPASVSVAAGNSTATFNVTTSTVTTSKTVTLTASFNSSSKSATLKVDPTPAVLSSLSVSPTTVLGGSATVVTGTVTLDKNALTATQVQLSSGDTAATVPASVTVPSGSNTATFNVTTSVVNSDKTVTLTATLSGASKTAALKVQTDPNPKTITVKFTPNSLAAAATGTGTVSIDKPAPAAGFAVTVSSSSTSALKVPTSLVILAGKTSVSFTATAGTPPSPNTVTLKATHSGFTDATTTVKVLPPAVKSIAITPDPVLGGNSVTVTVTLASKAGSTGPTVTLKSSSTFVTVPASFKIAAGQTSGSFTATTLPADGAKSATIYANTSNTAIVTKSFNLNPSGLSNFTLSPNPVKGGQDVTGTVTLDGPAGPSGKKIILSTSSQSAVPVPATVTIPAGASSITFKVATGVVTADKSVNVSATLGTQKLTVSLTVQK
jgi:subtilase family serine protease